MTVPDNFEYQTPAACEDAVRPLTCSSSDHRLLRTMGQAGTHCSFSRTLDRFYGSNFL